MEDIAFEEVIQRADLEDVAKLLEQHLPNSYKLYLQLKFYLTAKCCKVSEFKYRFFVSTDQKSFVFITWQGRTTPNCVIFTTASQLPEMFFLDWSNQFYIMVSRDDLIDKTSLAAQNHNGKINWLPLHYLYTHETEKVDDHPKSQIPEGAVVAPLQLEHAEMVAQSWPYNDPATIPYIQSIIQLGQARGVFLDSSRDPVSWVLLLSDGSLGMLYTKPSHRKKKLATFLLENMTQVIVQDGLKLYAHVVSEATGSIKAFETAKFQNICPMYWGIYSAL